MGFFKRNQSDTSAAASSQRPAQAALNQPQPAAIDEFNGDAELRQVSEALRQGDWKAADAFLNSRNDPNWSERVLRVEGSTYEVASEWVEAEGSCRSLTFRASAEIDLAWEARGGGFADTVTADGAATFIDLLIKAEQTLVEAVMANPASPEPWGLLLTTAMGLSRDMETKQKRFETAHALHPFHTYSVRAMLNILAEKWGGSEELMLEFARWVEAHAPAGSPSRTAMSTAWYECASMHAIKASRSGNGRGFLIDFSSHLTGTGDAELFQSMNNLLDALDETGIAHPCLVGTFNTLLFMTGPTNADTAHLTLRCVKAINNRPTTHPWNLLAKRGDVVGVFQKQQQRSIATSKQQIMLRERLVEAAKKEGIDLPSGGEQAA